MKKYFSSFKFDGVNEDDENIRNYIIGLEDDEERYLLFSHSTNYDDSKYFRDKKIYTSAVKYSCFLKTDSNENILKIYFFRIIADDNTFKTKIDKIAVDVNDKIFLKKLEKISFCDDENYQLFDNLFDRTHLVNEFKTLYRKTKDYLFNSNLIQGINCDDDKKYYIDLLLTRFLFLWFLQKKEGKLLDNDENYLINKFQNYKNNFYKNFLEEFFFTSLCYADSNNKKQNLVSKIGNVPYLNSGLFLKSKIEESYLIEIDDNAFYIDESTTYGLKNIQTYSGAYPIFNVFDSRDWTNLTDKVLGDIFEELMNTDERKGTGAYYTPSIITKYMSKHTIEPFLLNSLEERGFKVDCLNHFFENNYNSKAGNELFLSLKDISIVDNACGSGHYLADASEYLVSIWEKLKEKEFDGEIKTISREGLIITKKVNESSSKDFAYHIIINNIYGVDLNKEAIEIAKLRMFLFMADKFESIEDVIPLPNIAFNIEHGNALIGFTEIKDLTYELKGFIFDDNLSNVLSKYLDRVQKIENTENLIDELRYFMRERRFKEGEVVKNFFRIRNSLIDIFKNLHNPQEAILLRDFIIDLSKYFDKKLNQFFLSTYLGKTKITLEELESKTPFHWLMRFSDVFEKGGFDIVIGNPPYVRQELIKEDKPYLEKVFKEVYDGTADLSTYFVYNSLNILKKNGIHSYIITNKWMKAKYGTNIRSFLKENTKILELVDFNGVKVFVGATVDVVMYIVLKNKPNINDIKVCNNFENLINLFCIQDLYNLDKIIKKNNFLMEQESLNNSIWNLIDKVKTETLKILSSNNNKLKNFNIKINRGLTLGFNEAFIIDTNKKKSLIQADNKNKEIIKRIMMGRDLDRFVCINNKNYIINFHNNPPLEIKNYPVIKNHLDNYYDNLSKRLDKGKTPYNLRNCAYLKDFDKNKIIWNRITDKVYFSYDNNQSFVLDSMFFITGEKLKYLTLILNSTVNYFILKNISASLGKGIYAAKIYVENVPIATTPNTKPFEIISDYLLFSNQWLQENDKKQDTQYFKIREISQFFDNLANALVYELYLKEELEKDGLYYDLLQEIEVNLKDINFDDWSKELFKDEEEQDKNKLKEIESKNIEILFEVYDNLDIKNIQIDIEEMKTNEYIKIIEESGN